MNNVQIFWCPVGQDHITNTFWDAPFSEKGAKPFYNGTRDIYSKNEINGVGIWK